MKKIIQYFSFKNERGVTLAFVALLLFVFLGVGALVVDLGLLYAAKNELQNAADAGALAGARVLYSEDGTSVNTGAVTTATNAAIANFSHGSEVEVHEGDVKIGHWSFGLGSLDRGFHESSSTSPPDLWNRSTVELDEDINFINAVQVTTRREATKVGAFFSRIFNYTGFDVEATAVGYIGFAGSLRPEDVDQPIAICRQSIIDADGNYTCNTGRMIDSGGGTTHNTAAWTNFSQPCQTASANSVRPLVCGDGNPNVINFGEGMGTTGGMQDNVYRDMLDCWLNASGLDNDWRGYPRDVWSLTLPVIDCPSNNPGPCSVILGAVTLDVVWIKQSGSDPQWKDVPFQMQHWECSEWVAAGRPETGNMNNPPLNSDQRHLCFQEFAQEFNLRTANETSIANLTHSDVQKTILFLPSCEAHEPKGTSGGDNYGVLARIPVLVD